MIRETIHITLYSALAAIGIVVSVPLYFIIHSIYKKTGDNDTQLGVLHEVIDESSSHDRDAIAEVVTNATTAVTEAAINATAATTEVMTNTTTTVVTNITNFVNSTASDLQDGDQWYNSYNMIYSALVAMGIAVSVPLYFIIRSTCKKVSSNDTQLDAAFYRTELDDEVHNTVAGESSGHDVEYSHVN